MVAVECLNEAALSAVSPGSRPRPTVGSGGLYAVDACARDPEARGVVHVEAAAPARAALVRHLGRRARAAGRSVVIVGDGLAAEPWREIASRLGAAACTDPRDAAAAIRARAGRSVLLVTEGAPTRWGRAVAGELERAPDGAFLAVILADRAPPSTEARVIELGQGLSPDEARLWCEAVAADADEPMAPPLLTLEALDAWWAVARATPATARPPVAPLEADEDACAAARVLEAVVPLDAWALMRAAELHAAGGDHERAEEVATRALRAVMDVTARSDFWARYDRVLDRQPEDEAAARRLRAAELALRLGDVDCALDLVQAAVAKQDDTFEGMWRLGCATSARGDLTTASIALGKALARAPDAASRAAAAAELADVRYLAGDFLGARSLAEEACALAGDAATRLTARNVLGKLHFVAAAWSEAEQHFAADACEAMRARDSTAELRARLNRAIALLQWGRRDQARATLLAVLDDGQRAGERKAVAHALHNLAVEAHLRQDHAEALRRYEQAIEAAQRIGEQIPLTKIIRSMAELKLDVGLVDEAEQTLAFGRKGCGPGMPGHHIVHFELLTARIYLARGRTVEATGAVGRALAHCALSDTGQMSTQCHLLAARIALEDGDLVRTASALATAREGSPSRREAAEVVLLEAQRARAAGEPFAGAALEALEQARSIERPDLILEAHIVLACPCEGHDAARAATHLAAARALRDRMAAALPPELRPRFLARRDLVALARLEVQAMSAVEISKSVANRPCVRPSRADAPDPSSRIVGRDPAIAALRGSILRMASVDGTLLILGDSGTGKELVADAVHAASGRRSGPLVKVNCAALVEDLLLSELFGHEKGAFSGATARKEGRFGVAEGGTIFLDEIGDISPRTQTALLRVLQAQTYERVGGTTTLHTNCRVVCATHRDLEALVAEGRFREDLYFRLAGLVIQVPPLRRRPGDLPLLVEAILDRIAEARRQPVKRLSTRAIATLGRHDWPGNVRELENALSTATLFAEGDVVDAEDFIRHVKGLGYLASEPGANASRPAAATPCPTPGPSAPRTLRAAEIELGRKPLAPDALVDAARACIKDRVPLADMKDLIERKCLEHALSETKGNITRAAEMLGMKRSRVSQLVKEHGLRPAEVNAEETGS